VDASKGTGLLFSLRTGLKDRRCAARRARPGRPRRSAVRGRPRPRAPGARL